MAHKTYQYCVAENWGKVTQAQADWDALPAEQKAPTAGFESITRPTDITLTE